MLKLKVVPSLTRDLKSISPPRLNKKFQNFKKLEGLRIDNFLAYYKSQARALLIPFAYIISITHPVELQDVS